MIKKVLCSSFLLPFSVLACPMCFFTPPWLYKIDSNCVGLAWLIAAIMVAIPMILYGCGFRLEKYQRRPRLRLFLDAGMVTLVLLFLHPLNDSFGTVLYGAIFFIPNCITVILLSILWEVPLEFTIPMVIVFNFTLFLLVCLWLGRYRLVRKRANAPSTEGSQNKPEETP